MDETTAWLERLLIKNGVEITPDKRAAFEQFAAIEDVALMTTEIFAHQRTLMNKWSLHSRLIALKEQPFTIPNAKVGTPYSTFLDFEALGWQDVKEISFPDLERTGLQYDSSTHTINGTPKESGDFKICLAFKLGADETLHEKTIPFIVNPDPKTLWKDLESNREELFWKEDTAQLTAPLGEKHLVAVSKRGRAHANVGSFRDDDFACCSVENDWSVIAVADGAGSARLAREGSRLACQTVIEYFSTVRAAENFALFDTLITTYNSQPDEQSKTALQQALYQNIGGAALTVHKKLEEAAVLHGADIRDFHTTLIFTLLKKYPFGYALLSFGVGDCPIVVLSKDLTQVNLMNKLDVGEYGGGTRFITMPDIFQSPLFSARFGFQVMSDFGYLVMMTDGIYDPKFGVEAYLEMPEQWQSFFADLSGHNEDEVKVTLTADNPDVATQLAQWMDFWSPGNHDDRTLVIVY